MSSAAVDCEPSLSPDLLLCVLELLPANELPCTARLVCSAAAAALHSLRHRTVRLSRPLPRHASGWWRHWQPGLRQLSFRAKLHLLATAAASGCLANLEVAWRLLQPCMLPELMPSSYAALGQAADPGVTAVRCGHTHLLPWLLARRCPVDPDAVLAAAAEHASLPDLAATWRALADARSPSPEARTAAAAACGQSDMANTLQKLQFLQARGCDVLTGAAAAAAARLGDAQLLEWVQRQGAWGQGGSFRQLFRAALAGSASTAFVNRMWGMCSGHVGPLAGEHAAAAAASRVEGVRKLAWLRARGVQPGPLALLAAVCAGRLEAVRYLLDECGVVVDAADGPLGSAAASSPCGAVLRHLVGCGVGRSAEAWVGAAQRADLPRVRWLVGPQGAFPVDDGSQQGTITRVIRAWPRREAHMGYAGSSSGSGVDDGGGGGDWEGSGSSLGRTGAGDDGDAAGSGGGGTGAAAGVWVRGMDAELLAAVRLLAAAGAPLHGPSALAAAARRGSLPLVRWLCEEQGCMGGGSGDARPVLAAAAAGGCEAVMEYVHARAAVLGCSPGGEPEGRVYVAPAAAGDVGTLRALHGLGVPWSGALLPRLVVEGVRLPVLRWLVEELGLPVLPGRAAEAAARAACARDEAMQGWLRGLLA